MRHRVEYLIVKMVELAVRPLPLQAVRRLGEALGLLFYTVDRVHRRIALANLAVAFPARTARERQAIAKSSERTNGTFIVDVTIGTLSSVKNEFTS